MESNHPRSVTPRNSVLKTGGATGPHPPPESKITHLARGPMGVQVRVTPVGGWATLFSTSTMDMQRLRHTKISLCDVLAVSCWKDPHRYKNKEPCYSGATLLAAYSPITTTTSLLTEPWLCRRGRKTFLLPTDPTSGSYSPDTDSHSAVQTGLSP